MSVQNCIYLTIQLLACCAAIYYWRHYRQTPMWIFLPFLIYTFCNEILAIVLSYHYPVRILYNLYILISFGVYMYWFDKLLKFRFWKWIIWILFAAAFIYDAFTINLIKNLIKTTVNVQAVLLLIFSLVFFVKLLRSNEVIYYQRLPEFWIVCGLLMFYIGYVPLSLYLGQGYNILHIYYIAIIILNLLLYGGYIVGFYVSGRR